MPMTVFVDYVVQRGKTVMSRHRVAVDGEAVRAVDDADPDAGVVGVTFTLTPPLAESVASGALDLSVGFMRGDVKMSGDFGALLEVLPTLARTTGL
jgi:hypothetical protein